MIDLSAALKTLTDLARMAESVTLECKLAQGQDGKGELPKDFWPTYSAMANAHGGVVLPPCVANAGAHSSGEMTVETRVQTRVQTTVKILSMLKEDRTLSSNQLSAALGKSQSAIERALKKLREQGLIRHVGPNKGGHWEILK